MPKIKCSAIVCKHNTVDFNEDTYKDAPSCGYCKKHSIELVLDKGLTDCKDFSKDRRKSDIINRHIDEVIEEVNKVRKHKKRKERYNTDDYSNDE